MSNSVTILCVYAGWMLGLLLIEGLSEKPDPSAAFREGVKITIYTFVLMILIKN